MMCNYGRYEIWEIYFAKVSAPVRSLCSKASCQIASKTKQSHSARSLLRQSIAKRSLPSLPLFLFSLSFSITLLQPHEQALISVSLSLQLNKAYSPMTTNSRHSGLGAASRERWLLHLDPGVQAREGIFVRSCCQLLFSPGGNTSVSQHRSQTVQWDGVRPTDSLWGLLQPKGCAILRRGPRFCNFTS